MSLHLPGELAARMSYHMLCIHAEWAMQNALFLVSECHRLAAEWPEAVKQGYLCDFKWSVSSQVMFCDECGSVCGFTFNLKS